MEFGSSSDSDVGNTFAMDNIDLNGRDVLVQDEAGDGADPELMGHFAAIGIVKGNRFIPTLG